MIAQRTLARAMIAAPRLAAVRSVNTAAGAATTTAAVRAPAQPAVQGSPATKATLTTTASNNASSFITSSPNHIVNRDGRVKSSHRHFHANGSESTSGLNDFSNGAEQRQRAKLLRMQEAKELAGL